MDVAWHTRRMAYQNAELVAIERRRHAEEQAAAQVDFRLVPADGNFRFTLVNRGSGSAYGVKVHLPGGPSDGPGSYDEVPPGSAGQYFLAHKRPITVVWHQVPDLSDPPRNAEVRPGR